MSQNTTKFVRGYYFKTDHMFEPMFWAIFRPQKCLFEEIIQYKSYKVSSNKYFCGLKMAQNMSRNMWLV